MASAAPAKHSRPRHTVQRPADSDHSIVPSAKITPTPMNAQGLASYNVCGVHVRMPWILPRKQPVCAPAGFVYNPPTMSRKLFARLGLTSPWSVELAVAAAGLLIGAAIMPVLIFYAGATILGRYEGAGLGPLFRSVYTGLGEASLASWTVLLGPYGLYLLFRGLRAWWRASAHLT